MVDHELVVHDRDDDVGLRAIVAIHDTSRGPAVGGCRMWPYASEDEALRDVLRLSRAMSYKCALAGLPFGGGKSVIIGDPRRDKSDALLERFGRLVESFDGAYRVAEDVGIGSADVAVMGRATRYVAGIHRGEHASGDPSPFTVELFGAERVTAVEIYGAEADVFAPCALGGVIDDRTIDGLSARVVAGAANVQLAEPRHGDELHHRGILYAPDYVINAGGVINGSGEILGTYDAASARRDVLAIGPRLADLFDRAAAEAQAPGRVADEMAEAVLEAARERRVARARS